MKNIDNCMNFVPVAKGKEAYSKLKTEPAKEKS